MKSWNKVKRSEKYQQRIKTGVEELIKRAREIDNENAAKHGGQQSATKKPKLRPIRDKHRILPPATTNDETINHVLASPVSKQHRTSNSSANDSFTVFFDGEPEGERDEIEKNQKARSSLRIWAKRFNLNHATLHELFKILNVRCPNMLPDNPRVLLYPPQTVAITAFGNGADYWHHGVESCLKMLFWDLEASITISLNIHMDYSHLFAVQLLPIWFNIAEMPDVPVMVIGVYCGIAAGEGPRHDHVDLESFLSPFVNEMCDIMTNGVCINSHKISVSIRCFVCNSSTRAYLKGLDDQYRGCLKCDQRADKLRNAPRLVDSPLSRLNFDLIEQFPLCDALHVLHLSVMRRLLGGWRYGGTTFANWSAKQVDQVSKYLIECKLPAELHGIRSLEYLIVWSATEYRAFLHYAAIVVLKDCLTPKVYSHFMLLFCSVTICSSQRFCDKLRLAHQMLLDFIGMFAEIYGQQHSTCDVHALSHLVGEVERFGELDSFSAYPFDRALGQLMRLYEVDGQRRSLAQVAKLIIEEHNVQLSHNNGKAPLSKPQKQAILEDRLPNETLTASLYAKIHLNNEYFLATDPVNCWFLTKHNRIACCTKIIRQHIDDRVQLFCSMIAADEHRDFFEMPIRSRYINIFVTHREAHQNAAKCKMRLLYLKDVECKLVRLVHHELNVFVPLLHHHSDNNKR